MHLPTNIDTTNELLIIYRTALFSRFIRVQCTKDTLVTFSIKEILTITSVLIKLHLYVSFVCRYK